MKRILISVLGAAALFASPALAEPPDNARNDTGTLHPGHQGHLSSGREYPGKAATDFHDGTSYETGPGGYAEQQSGGANAQRSSAAVDQGQ
jgi:hypothetical protein